MRACVWVSAIRMKTKNSEQIWVFCDGSTDVVPHETKTLVQPTVEQGGRDSGSARPWRKYFLTGSHCGASAVARGHTGQILDWRWQRLPAVTNNEAEYAGLILGLDMARQLNAVETLCVLDSDVVVGQMTGRFAVKSYRLRKWHWKACAAARLLPGVRYLVVPREWNRLADGLAAQALMPWRALQPAIERFNQ